MIIKIFDKLIFNAVVGVVHGSSPHMHLQHYDERNYTHNNKPKVYLRKEYLESRNTSHPKIYLDETRPQLLKGKSLKVRFVGEWYKHYFNDDKHCAVCGKPIRQRKRGRTKKYCCDSCKQLAKRLKEYDKSFLPIEKLEPTFNDLGHMHDDMVWTKLLQSEDKVLMKSFKQDDNYWGVGTGLLLEHALTDKVKEGRAVKKELQRIRKM